MGKRNRLALAFLSCLVCACDGSGSPRSENHSSEDESLPLVNDIVSEESLCQRIYADGICFAPVRPSFAEPGGKYDIWYDYADVEFYQRAEAGWIRMDRPNHNTVPDQDSYFLVNSPTYWRPEYWNDPGQKGVLTRAFIRTLYGGNATFDFSSVEEVCSRNAQGEEKSRYHEEYQNAHFVCDMTSYYWSRDEILWQKIAARPDSGYDINRHRTVCHYVENGERRMYFDGEPYVNPNVPDLFRDVCLPIEQLEGHIPFLPLLLEGIQDIAAGEDGRYHFRGNRSHKAVTLELEADFALADDGLSIQDIVLRGHRTVTGTASKETYVANESDFEAHMRIYDWNATRCAIPDSFKTPAE